MKRKRRVEDLDLANLKEPVLVRKSGTVVDLSDRARYLAMFDILGYRDLLRRVKLVSLIDLAMRPKSMAHLAASGRWRYDKAGHAVPENRHRSVGVAAYVDTILLYSYGKRPLDLAQLLSTAHGFMSMVMAQGILLRGAVTKGQLYASKSDDIYTGEAMVRAYELEQAQDWAGAIVDTERIHSEEEQVVLKYGEEAGKLFQFTAPMKKGPIETRLCIGWPLGMGMNTADWAGFVGKVYGAPPWQGFRKLRWANDFLQNHRRKWPVPELKTAKGEDGSVVLVGRDWLPASDYRAEARFEPITFELAEKQQKKNDGERNPDERT